MRNSMKVWLLMAALTVLLVLFGDLIGGRGGAQFFFVIAVAMNFFGYWFSDKIATAMTRSRPVEEHEAPQLYAIISRLAQKAGLPMPRVYVTPSAQPNAFATGRNPQHAAVAVTEGIMRILSQDELEGVLAHEMAHIKNRDILVSSLAATLAGAITMLADIARWGLIFGAGRSSDDDNGGAGAIGSLLMIILAPIAALLIQLAISRSREYLADETGARIAGRADGLANALLKLERGAQAIPMEVSPSAAHLFIVNPLSGQSLAQLFSTHPPISERVERLRRLELRLR